jgi:hypothetical protein
MQQNGALLYSELYQRGKHIHQLQNRSGLNVHPATT